MKRVRLDTFLHRDTVGAVVDDFDRFPTKRWSREVCVLLMYLELAFTDLPSSGTFEERLQEVVSRIEARLETGRW